MPGRRVGRTKITSEAYLPSSSKRVCRYKIGNKAKMSRARHKQEERNEMIKPRTFSDNSKTSLLLNASDMVDGKSDQF